MKWMQPSNPSRRWSRRVAKPGLHPEILNRIQIDADASTKALIGLLQRQSHKHKMEKLRLHLDADTSIKALFAALRERGHDVSRTPNDWMPLDADDRAQLLGASAQGRVIFSFNIRDFLALAKQFPNHGGILLAAQSHWSLAELITALDRAMRETDEKGWQGQVRWLNDFK